MHKNILLVLLLMLVMNGCSDSTQQREKGTKTSKRVYTVNYPLYYFTQRLAPESIEVVFPVPNDVDPAFWQPNTEEILGFSQADLIILNGADYAKWRSTASLPASKLVNTSKAFEKEYIHIESTDHAHGPGGEHSHTGTAFTTWLDMQQAIKQAEAIKDALVLIEPEEKEQIERAYQQLKEELTELDTGFRNVLKDHHMPMIASHPVYQYFARAYGLNLKALLWEPEMKIDKKAEDEINALLAVHPARVMIWEGKPIAENLGYTRSLGLQNVVIEPCMNRPESGDFITQMKENIKILNR